MVAVAKVCISGSDLIVFLMLSSDLHMAFCYEAMMDVSGNNMLCCRDLILALRDMLGVQDVWCWPTAQAISTQFIAWAQSVLDLRSPLDATPKLLLILMLLTCVELLLLSCRPFGGKRMTLYRDQDCQR